MKWSTYISQIPVPEQFQNSSKIYKFKSHRLCLLEIQDLTTKWGEFAVPYIPFDWGGIWGGISPSFPRDPFHTPFIWAGFLPIVQCDPNIICLLIITLGIFIWVALYHMWIRARTLTAPKVASLCSKVQNVSEFEGGDF